VTTKRLNTHLPSQRERKLRESSRNAPKSHPLTLFACLLISVLSLLNPYQRTRWCAFVPGWKEELMKGAVGLEEDLEYCGRREESVSVKEEEEREERGSEIEGEDESERTCSVGGRLKRRSAWMTVLLGAW
jgi:hypothetical protein